MAEEKRDTTVVHSSGGGAGWFLIGGLVVAAFVALWLFMGGGIPGDGGKDVDVQVELPKAE